MSPTVGYATLQVIPSLRGVHTTIRQELNGQDIGAEVGADLSDGISSGFDSDGLLSKLSGPMGAAGLALGTAIGAAALTGIQEAIGSQAAQGLTQAQLGLSEAQAAAYGDAAGAVYAANFGDSLAHANEAVAAVGSSLAGSLGPGEDALQRVTEQALTFAQVFGSDVAEATTVAGTAIRVGLAGDATEAFDLMTAASQKMPAGIRSELLPAVEEYGVYLSELGFTGEEAFGLLAEASKGGAVQLDKAGDALKEFQILATDGSESTATAFESIGLDAHDMASDILAGGDVAKAAFDQIVAGLLAVQDPTEQAAAALALFGTPLEDVSVSQIPAFLEGLQSTDGALGDFQGATDAAAAAVGDGLGSKLETLKREAMTELVSFTEARVLPVLSATADGLAAVGGFAGDNVEVITVLTSAWVGLKAVQLTQAAWATLTVGATAASTAFDRLAIAAYNAAGGVSATAIAAGAVTGALAGGALAYMSLQRSADNAAEANERFLESIDFDPASTNLDTLAADILAMNDEIESLNETAGKGDLEQFWQNINPWVDNDIEEARTRVQELDGLIASTAEMTRTLFEVSSATGLSSDALDGWIDRLDLDPATMSTEELTAAISDAQAMAASGAPAVDRLADAAETLGDETATATDQLNAFKETIDAIIGTQISAEEALLNFTSGLQDLFYASRDAAEAGEEWSTSLTGLTPASIETREMVSGLAQDAIDLAVAYGEAGGGIEGATYVLEGNRQKLIEAGIAAGISRGEMETYLATLGLTPENITTVIQAQTDDASLSAADQALDWVSRDRDVRLTAVWDIVRGEKVPVSWLDLPERWGGITHYATGGIHAHVARGDVIRYAEPATGGEAFIPRLGDRDRSMSVLRHAAGWLDASVIDKKRLSQSVTAGGSAAGPTVVNLNAIPMDTAAELEADGGHRLRRMGLVVR